MHRPKIPGETIRMAIGNIRAQKFRSFLTVLGIVIGVMTVIIVASLLTGMRSGIVSMIEEYGTNNIYAFHLTTGPQFGERDRSERLRKPLTRDDGEAILNLAPAVEDVAAQLMMWMVDADLEAHGQTYKQGQLTAVTPAYSRVANLGFGEGRGFTEVDDEHRRDVMVIGVNVVEALFPQRSRVVGEKVQMAGRTFEIIGVLQKRKSGFFGQNEEDNAILIPFNTGREIAPQNEFLMLLIRARQGRLSEALSQVEEVLRNRRGVRFDKANDFDLSTADRIVQQFDSIMGGIGMVAIAISAVGLLVGGIGVMNIMLVSVTERTREIGIRKAVGARKGDIVRQFLFEAMTLTFLGGLIGVGGAIAISTLLALLFPSLPAAVPLWAVITGLVVSTGVGLVFGVWPARKASLLDPIECLRYE
jgi:putative ABC transport system permease protein